MNSDQLKALQAPLKERYRENPSSAVARLHSEGRLRIDELICQVQNVRGSIPAGLHPFAGGDGGGACSGDMLLDALVACAGVTLGAVATAMGIPVRGGTVAATGEMDFRGTLGVSKEAPIGLTNIRLHFTLDSDANEEQLSKLIKLTERYCVIYQTLQQPPRMTATVARG